MKAIKVIFMALVMMLGASSAMTVNAQFRFGVKAGINVNSLHFNEDVFDADNQTGFTGGLMTEFTVPVIGVGFDLSAMYVRRNAKFMKENNIATDKRDYIEIPLNLKWKIGVPVISKIVSPFITTGPSVSFLTSRKFKETYENKSCDWAWNFGIGLQFVNKVQVHASYGLGLTKAVKTLNVADTQAAGIDGKNRYWTITAAYLF